MSGTALAMSNSKDALRPKTRQGWAEMNIDRVETGTALVAVGQAAEREKTPFRTSRPSAPFVAHLIATASGVEQTRALRRAVNVVALQGYRCVQARRTETSRSNGYCVSLVA